MGYNVADDGERAVRDDERKPGEDAFVSHSEPLNFSEADHSSGGRSPGRTFEVRFGAPTGRRVLARTPSGPLRLLGRGRLTITGDAIRIDGKRHRNFLPSLPVEEDFPLNAIANVARSGRYVRLEVRTEDRPPLLIAFETASGADAEAVADLLPKVTTEDFLEAAAEHADFRSKLDKLDAPPVVTRALVGANVLVYLLMGLAGAGFYKVNPVMAIHWGTNFGPLTMDGQWWRLFTCMFVHFGFLHIFFNMWVLYDIGRMVERFFGGLYFLALYLFSGLAASMSSLLWHSGVNSAGASGAIFGIIGGMLAFLLRKDNDLPLSFMKRYRNVLTLFVAYALIFSFTQHGIDNAAHVGGLVSGFLMGFLLARPLDLERRKSGQIPRILRAGAFGAVVLTVMWLPLRYPRQSVRADLALSRDVLQCARADTVTITTYKTLMSEGRTGKLTDRQFADRFETRVLPLWENLYKDLKRNQPARNSSNYKLHQAYLEYVSITRDAVRLFVKGARQNDRAALEQAKKKFDERQKVIAEIDRLQKGK